MTLLEERVLAARSGKNGKVIARMASGWAVMGDVQFLRGYCLLLADPLVPSLNHLQVADRSIFLSDMTRIGDALLEVTRARRINYEILGNTEPLLHAHIFPRFEDEEEGRRAMPAWFYDWANAPRFSIAEHASLLISLRDALKTGD